MNQRNVTLSVENFEPKINKNVARYNYRLKNSKLLPQMYIDVVSLKSCVTV